MIIVYIRGFADRNSRAFIKYVLNELGGDIPIAALNDCNLPGARIAQSCYHNEDLVTEMVVTTEVDKALSFESSLLFLPSDALQFELNGHAVGMDVNEKEIADLNRFYRRSSFLAWGDTDKRDDEFSLLLAHKKKWQMEKVDRNVFLDLILNKLKY